MMYVRTKDGVYEVEQSQLEDDEEVVNCDYGQIHKLEILRKSENLEELCDEFVRIVKRNKLKSLITLGAIEHLKEHSQNFINDFMNTYEIYGAIWTDKGLIYVAKMNDKGELELI